MLKDLADAGWGYSQVELEVDTPNNVIKLVLTNENFPEVLLTIIIDLTNGDSLISTELTHKTNSKYYSWDNYLEENSSLPSATEIKLRATKLTKEA